MKILAVSPIAVYLYLLWEACIMKKMNPIPKEMITELAEKARAYLCTAEGERSLLDAFQRGKVEAQRLREISKPDPQSLKMPITI